MVITHIFINTMLTYLNLYILLIRTCMFSTLCAFNLVSKFTVKIFKYACDLRHIHWSLVICLLEFVAKILSLFRQYVVDELDWIWEKVVSEIVQQSWWFESDNITYMFSFMTLWLVFNIIHALNTICYLTKYMAPISLVFNTSI